MISNFWKRDQRTLKRVIIEEEFEINNLQGETFFGKYLLQILTAFYF